MNQPKICVSILNWNNSDDTIQCIESLSKTPNLDFEIIILDNGSTDESINKLANLKKTTLIKSQTNLGFAGGHNLIIKTALSRKFDYVWLLNNDTIVAPDCLEKLITHCEANKNTGMASPIIKDREAPHMLQHVLSLLNSTNTGIFECMNINEAIELQKSKENKVILWGTALLIKMSTIEKVGLLDENLFAYSEDTDYSLRCIKNNFFNKVIFDAEIFHHRPNGLRKNHYFYYTHRNSFLTWKKYIGLYDLIRSTRWNLKLAQKQINSLENNHDSISSIKLGIWHGWTNRGGAYSSDVKISMIGLFFVNALLKIA